MTIILPDPPWSGPGFSTDAEIAVNRRLTHEFIMRRPVTITLVPRNQVKKPAGGFVWADQTPRPPQVMTLIEPGDSGLRPATITADGIERVVDFELLGEWDAAVDRNDRFTNDEADWEIVALAPFNGYEQRAMVSRRG